MSNYQLIEVTNSNEVKAFHQVCDVVYTNDPIFVHYIINDVEEVFDPQKNKLYAKGWQSKRWILQDGNKPIGRVAAFCRVLSSDKADKGGFGFFESINDEAAANQLFDAAENWLKSMGAESIDAPINFGDRDSFWGLLVDGKTAPSYRENYHPTYYKSFFDKRGYELIIEQYTYDISEKDFNFERFSKIAERVTGSGKYRFEFLDYGQLDKYTADFVEIYNQAWSFHEDFEPLTKEVLLKRFQSIKPAMPKEFAVFAYEGDKPIGFFISILELNLVFKSFKGKLGLWQKISFMLHRGMIRRAKGIVFGIVPSHHNLGIETGMIIKFYEGFKKNNRLDSMELSWIGDFNPKMISMLQSLGAHVTKTHQTLRKKNS